MSSGNDPPLPNPPPHPWRGGGEGGGRRWWFLAAAVTIAVLPIVFQDSYWRTNLIICALNVMLAVGLDFILGYAGQLNLGHSAFYGIGAYASTLLVMTLGVP